MLFGDMGFDREREVLTGPAKGPTVRALTAVIALIGSALLPPGPSFAVGGVESCQGQSATIVGTPDQSTLTGTAGPDVIISGGAVLVSALGGDDLVCVTGATHVVDAGTGDDLVDARERLGDGRTVVGDGADTYLGGPGFDEVDAGGIATTGFYEDGHRDVIRTGTGGALVSSGVAWELNDDVLVLGRGGWITDVNTVAIAGRLVPDGRLHFGNGKAVLRVREASSGAGDWLVDNRERRISVGTTTWLSWTGYVSEFDVELLEVPGGEGVAMDFLGTRKPETFHVDREVERLDARLGRGADLVVLPECESFSRGLLDLGPGRDTVQTGCDDLVVRLDRGRLQPRVSVRRLEALEVSGDHVSVWGDDAPNRVELRGCGGTVRGGAGADAIRVARRLCGGPGAQVYGGLGDDRLSGSPYADLLVGDRGRDVVDGKAGRDSCRAEVEFNCERG
jgi:Ca2+-binding RTX toxin-like protein